MQFVGGLQKHKSGNAGVQYAPDGRVITPNDGTYPRAKDKGYDDDYRSYDPHREQRRKQTEDQRRGHDDRRGGYEDRRGGYEDRRGGYEDRRGGYEDRREGHDDRREGYDDRRGGYEEKRGGYEERRGDYRDKRGGYDDYTGGHDDRRGGHDEKRRNYSRSPQRNNYNDRYDDRYSDSSSSYQYDTKRDWKKSPEKGYNYDNTGRIANRNLKGYNESSDTRSTRDYGDGPFGVVFVVDGILLIVCAVINVIMCTDYHYYVGFWAGIIVLEFGVCGMVHRGDYKTKWKNWAYILLGLMTTLVVFAGTAMLFEKVLADFIQLTTVSNADYYVNQFANIEPNVGGNITLATRVWVCLGIDCAMIIFFIFDYLALLAVMFAGNKFWDTNYRTNAVVQPWCSPVWFNPYGLLPLGEAVAFMGLLVRYGCYHNPQDIQFHELWAPVWAGAVIVIGGFGAIAGSKRPDRSDWNILAGLLELLGLLASIAALVLCMNAIVINVKSIVDGEVATGVNMTDDQRDKTSASVVLYCLTCILLLASALYTGVTMVRMFTAARESSGGPYRRDRDSRSFYSSESSDSYDRRHHGGGRGVDRYRSTKPGTGFDRDYDRGGYADSYFGNNRVHRY